MKKLFLLVHLMVFAAAGFADPADSLFEKANTYYKQGKYLESIAVYQKIVADGKSAPELYFNLGNAFYKTGDNVHAILFYERAARLAPQDEDIRFNLHMANLKVIDKITPLPDFFLARWWNFIVSYNSEDAWAKITISASFFIALMVIGFLSTSSYALKRTLFAFILFFLFLFVALFFVTKSAWEMHNKNTFALLLKNSTYVKSSPDEKSTDLFILHEGVKMKVIDAVGQWSRIRLADGNEGWVPANELITI